MRSVENAECRILQFSISISIFHFNFRRNAEKQFVGRGKFAVFFSVSRPYVSRPYVTAWFLLAITASQWRNVLFDPYFFKARSRCFVFLSRQFF